MADRVEIIVAGIAQANHVFSFQKYMGKVSDGSELPMANCVRCGSNIYPTDDRLREHAMLHVAIDAAKL
jgi:hypothetical protein